MRNTGFRGLSSLAGMPIARAALRRHVAWRVRQIRTAFDTVGLNGALAGVAVYESVSGGADISGGAAITNTWSEITSGGYVLLEWSRPVAIVRVDLTLEYLRNALVLEYRHHQKWVTACYWDWPTIKSWSLPTGLQVARFDCF